ncbi:MAG: hypothetical protein A2Z91_06555 [Deltaproteobacteria bacterium GWA2_38_16]|nr:MAG: hypothetical protein A2Z91_06555 [Deltaproteobacteria bacterium GWA2_38_16]OGQ03425.1 MAG: hypothetical protein A3D19_04855 [Deltaproteobacteria bacterium RIFCSPHIGHO2_02_FULL_38_15]OGQ30097.1 MAG: hypothetical protein A3A72_06930 [Deltaproteobacteria bacterium RIFCSPLOWO2_01_FULL_38_9]HBQ21365.1 hypothetical protein [Deltaproteobacteria bacterium]
MKTKMLEILGIFVCFLTLTACQLQKDNEKQVFDEWTKANGKNMSQGDWEQQNLKAQEMEADLLKLRRFYEALVGTFEGALKVGEDNFNVRIVFFPGWPKYPFLGPRIRTIDEVRADIMSLSFNVLVQQWNPLNTLSTVECIFEGVKPTYMNLGKINLSGQDCKNAYDIILSESASEVGALEVPSEATSAIVASQVLEGTLEKVSDLYGTIWTKATNSNFSLTRALQ